MDPTQFGQAQNRFGLIEGQEKKIQIEIVMSCFFKSLSPVCERFRILDFVILDELILIGIEVRTLFLIEASPFTVQVILCQINIFCHRFT